MIEERTGRESVGGSAEVVLRRFFREMQQSDLMTEIKERRYFAKPLSRNQRRTSAQARAVRRRIKRGY